MDQNIDRHRFAVIPGGRSPEAQQALQSFLTGYWQDIHDLLDSITLTVIVWGPGVAVNTPVTGKRKDIWNKLKEMKYNPVFSEEIDATEPPDLMLAGLGIHAFMLKILKQAQHGDYTVMLLDKEAYGVIGELVTICTRRGIAAKVFLMAPEVLKDTFVLQVATEMLEGGNGAVYWYTEEEITNCNVLTMALQRVRKLHVLLAYRRAMLEG